MLAAISRLLFTVSVLGIIAMFTLGSGTLKIDTNLRDLNPDNSTDDGLKFAIDTLVQDISQRFIVVVKGTSKQQVADATAALEQGFSKFERLSVLSASTSSEKYLAALQPYQFNLLTAEQRASLEENDAQQLASQALRKLYQLGDGIRLVPFEQDPLGWYSDYLLSRLDSVSANQALAEEDSEVSASQTAQFKSFTVAISGGSGNMDQQAELYAAIKALTDNTSSDYAVEVLYSGMFFFAVDSAQSAKQDIQLIAVGSVVGVIVLMLLVFRSLLPLTLSLVSIAVGVGFAILTSTLVFGAIHIFTIVFGASLIGIVVDYSLHYFYHFLAEDHSGSERRSASSHRALHRAMLLSVITSLVGYGALAISDLVLLQKIALFSCSGLFMAWLSVIVLGPLVTRRPIVARQRLLMSVIDVFHQLFARKPRILMVLGLAAAVAGSVYLVVSDIKTNDDPRRFFHVSDKLLNQEQEVARLTQVYEPGRYFIVKGRTEDEVYDSLEGFYQALGDKRSQVTSVLDWLPSGQTQQQNYQLLRKLYKDGGALDTFYEQLGVGSGASAAMKTAYQQAAGQTLDFPQLMAVIPSVPPLWVSHEGMIYSFILIRKGSDFATLEALSTQNDDIQYMNALGSAMEALKAQREIGSELLLVAYVLIGVMLAVYYREFSAVLMLLIPVTASVITLAVLAAIEQPITIFNVMALFLVLGLGMDYIIFAREMKDKQAVTQQAILLSAVTSLLSFGLLAFSSMPIVEAFGSTILIGNTINFIAAISLFNRPQTVKHH